LARRSEPRAAAVLVLAVLAGCSGTARNQTSAPAGTGWLEVRTAHFAISTDLDREMAEQVAVELESMFATLSELAFNAGQPPRVNISVVHFRRQQDYEALAPKRTGAFVFTQTGYDFEDRSRVVLHGELLKQTREVMWHELTHVFVGHYYPQAPVWLNEGLAEYYSTVAQEDGFTVIGRPGNPRFHRAAYQFDCPPEGCTVLVPVSDVRPIKDLVAMTPHQFYGDETTELDLYAEAAARQAISTNRATAGSLIRFLFQDADHRPAFEDFLARVRGGTRAADAWAATVGRLAPAKLEAAFRASLAPVGEVIVQRTEYAPPRRPPEAVRPLPVEEVQMLRAQLWPLNAGGLAAAGAELDRVPRPFHTDPRFVTLKAGWLHAGGQSSQARAMLEQALRDRPDDPALLSSLGRILLKPPADASTAPAADSTLKPLAEKLARVSRTAAHDHLVAMVHARQGALAMAMAHEKRALSRNENCVPCRVFLAELYDLRGQPANALAQAQLAEGLLREGRKVPELAERIRTYQAKLADAGAAKPAP
jgi:tetratricopeptide (TPR) repeat protein